MIWKKKNHNFWFVQMFSWWFNKFKTHFIFFNNNFKKTRNILSLSQMKANYIFFPQSNMGGCVSIIITLKKDLVAKMYLISWNCGLIELTWVLLFHIVSAGTADICNFEWAGLFNTCHSQDGQPLLTA